MLFLMISLLMILMIHVSPPMCWKVIGWSHMLATFEDGFL